MIFICGTDLESENGFATEALLDMLSAGVEESGPLNVVVETGGTRAWWLEALDERLNQRWRIVGDTMHPLASMPRASMGDPATLHSFIDYCMRAFPAERYGLILSNHGGGSSTGVCFDEFDEDYLTAAEINAVLSDVRDTHPGFRLSFFGLDACLMATYELACYVQEYADFMIASEELLPAEGFDYRSLFGALVQNPAIDGESLGRLMVDDFFARSLENLPDDYLTLSVLDLSKLPALTAAMEAIGGGLSRALDMGGLASISRSRQRMRSFGDFNESGSDMVDLGQFIETYGALSGADVSAALDALDGVVAYSRHTKANLDNISGMSILVPMRTRYKYDDYADQYDPLDRYPAYSDFLDSYVGELNEGTHAIAAGAPESEYHVAGAEPAQGAGPGVQGGVSPILGSAAASLQGTPQLGQGYFDADGRLSYSLTLSGGDMAYLSYAEGNLLIDISVDDVEAYVDLGFLRDTQIDWAGNTVYSLFDGRWPALQGQLVYMQDQSVTAASRRSLIDAYVNDVDTYLLVVFDEARPGGEVIGYTAGYNEMGAPIRGYTRLTPGDIITPQYYAYRYDENGEAQCEMLLGDPIEYTGEPLAFGYVPLYGEDMSFAYAYCLVDIYGDYTFSDFHHFSM